MELLELIFRSFWTFLGSVIILSLVGEVIIRIFQAPWKYMMFKSRIKNKNKNNGTRSTHR